MEKVNNNVCDSEGVNWENAKVFELTKSLNKGSNKPVDTVLTIVFDKLEEIGMSSVYIFAFKHVVITT